MGCSSNETIEIQTKKDAIEFENYTQGDQKTLEIVFLMLDKVEIKARRGEYSFQNTYHSTTFDSIVKWFISDVYEMDPNFVDRNYNLPEEEAHVKKLIQ